MRRALFIFGLVVLALLIALFLLIRYGDLVPLVAPL